MADAPLKVLFIGGNGRSGSTLLDRALGQLPGFVSVGEVRYIWREALHENRLCGCGVGFRDCPFWSEVGAVAFGGWDALDVEELIGLERSVARQRHLPVLLWPSLWPARRRRLHRYAGVMEALYAAIAAVSGATVIVDSSKDPAYGFLLRRVPGLDLRVVHLVRDSRGVAFSWAKHVASPEAAGGAVIEMNRYHPLTVAVRWVAYNLLVELLARTGAPAVRVRYEGLVEAPGREVSRAAALADEPPASEHLDFLDGETIHFEHHHTVAGNPIRLGAGQVVVRLDDEWTTKLGRGPRLLVTCLTWPLLRRYGYTGARRFDRSESLREEVGRP